MSVIVRGMRMPEACRTCRLGECITGRATRCRITWQIKWGPERPEDCPLEELRSENEREERNDE